MPRFTMLCVPALAGSLLAPLATAQSGGTASAEPVDWKDLTKSGLPIKFYGFLRLDAYYNTARFNNVILPATVLPENGTTAKPNDSEFFLDPRLTRFGFEVVPQKVGDSLIGGRLETDFANFPSGGTESRATPRIRLAYIDIDDGDYGFRIGQDWDTISPLYPAVNHELLQWNAGNVGDRRAQIQARYGKPSENGVLLEAALGLTGAINNQDLDAPPPAGVSTQVDGFDSGMPHLQVRAGLKQDLLVEKKAADVGIWGALGRTEVDTAINGETRFDTWVVGTDLQIPLCDSVTLRGEAWVGKNLGDFRGGIGSTVNPTTGSEVSAVGGWGELVYKASAKSSFHIGGSTDNPDTADLVAGSPTLNLVGYIGTVQDWDNGLRTGFDVLYWETDWVGLGTGNAVRFDLYFQYFF